MLRLLAGSKQGRKRPLSKRVLAAIAILLILTGVSVGVYAIINTDIVTNQPNKPSAQVVFSENDRTVTVQLQSVENADQVVLVDETGAPVETVSGEDAVFDAPEQQVGESRSIDRGAVSGTVLIVRATNEGRTVTVATHQL